MSKTQPKSSPTDEYARKIARALAKGRPPPFSLEFHRYCESCPREIFAAFASAARHMPPAGNDESLAIGYLFLLQEMLEHLRYRTDRDYADAAKLIADFQADVVAQVEAGNVDGGMLVHVGEALHQAKIPASQAFVAASAQLLERSRDGPLPADAALAGILDACGGDPFTAVDVLLQSSHVMPAEARSGMAVGLALAGFPEARATAVLFLLDPVSAVRRAAAGALAQTAARLTPTELRRLIAMRNWRPANERAEIDAIIRKTRAAGIDCAPWEAGSVEDIVATSIDGAATQGFLLISPTGRKRRISSVLTKGGIADAWSAEPESRRRIEASLAAAGMGAPKLPVSRSYLDRAVAHHLALGIENGKTPPLGLLQVAERIGGADWQPARMDFSKTLAGLIAEVPKTMRAPAALATLLRRSDELADLEAVAQSWFEDDPTVAEAAKRARGGKRAKLATYLLQTVMARHREKWAEIVLHTALWMREVPPEADLCWRELALVAKALDDGRDLTEIGLMRDIALRTIAVLRDTGRM
jgi:hypothetical protein